MSFDFAIDKPDPREGKRYYFQTTAIRWVMTPIVRSLFWLFASIHSHGAENIPKSGPVILAANHLSNFDVIPIQIVALPRSIFYIGKEELFRNPVLDFFLRQFGAFPVYRGARDEWAFNHARQVLERGQILGIFPEGKRSKDKSGLRPAKSGAARLALGENCPIVPVAVDGTQELLDHFPRRSQVRIIVGKPLYPRPGETQLALTDRLMFTLANMLPPESRGVYARRPPGFCQ